MSRAGGGGRASGSECARAWVTVRTMTFRDNLLPGLKVPDVDESGGPSWDLSLNFIPVGGEAGRRREEAEPERGGREGGREGGAGGGGCLKMIVDLPPYTKPRNH